MDCYPVELLCDGQEARIVEVCGDCEQVHRLAEIGIRSGSMLRMIHSGEPCLLAVDGRRLSVRLSHDVAIFVASHNWVPTVETV